MSDFCDPKDHSLLGSSVQLYENLEDLLKLTSKLGVLFITGDWNAKEGSQEIPETTDTFGLGIQNTAGQRLTVLSREHTDHSKHPFQQHKRQLYTWTSPDGQ